MGSAIRGGSFCLEHRFRRAARPGPSSKSRWVRVQPATIVPRPLLDCGQRTAKWFVSSLVRLAAD